MILVVCQSRLIVKKSDFFFNGTNDFFEKFFSIDLVGPIELIL